MTANVLLLMPHRLRPAVASAGAVFALLVSIAFKITATYRAGKSINGFTVDGFRVIVPPGHAAFIRAEPFLLHSSGLDKGGSALSAKNSVPLKEDFFISTTKIVPTAERLHRIFRNTKSCRYF